MALETWVTFCLLEIALCLSPGPAVILVVAASMRGGMRPGLAAALGVVAVNTLYFALSATGVAAVWAASREVFVALQWIGAAYLVVLGVRMLAAGAVPAPASQADPASRALVRGVPVQAANPKALVFFVALLPPFLSPAAPLTPQLVTLGATSAAIELTVLAAYAWLACRAGRVVGAHAARWLERAGGAFLVAAGVRLAMSRPSPAP
jgi:homoserine/homoserine lactone efflux protein